MKNYCYIAVLLSLMILGVALFAGCGGFGTTITVAGSTTVQPLAELLAAAYMDNNPGVTISVQGGGSSLGIRSAADGLIDIGTSSRELVGNEKKMGLSVYLIARDAIAVIVHPSQKITNLTMEQTRDIFAGKIVNWSHIGGDDKPIHVVSWEEGSGTRTTFEEIVLNYPNGPMITDTAILQSTSDSVRATVAGDPDAIGYLSLGYADSSVKTVALNDVIPTRETVLDETYPIVRPLFLLTRGKPGGKIKEFIEFCLSPAGQDIVDKEYVRIDYITSLNRAH